MIFRILFYEKQNGKETCRSSPIAADGRPARPGPRLESTMIFYRYIFNLFIWYDPYHGFLHTTVPVCKTPHEVFVYVGRFLLSVIAAMCAVCLVEWVEDGGVCVQEICFSVFDCYLITDIYVFWLRPKKNKQKRKKKEKKKKTFCVWSSVCLNSETQSDETKQQQQQKQTNKLQTSRWQFICILVFASFVRTEHAVCDFCERGSNDVFVLVLVFRAEYFTIFSVCDGGSERTEHRFDCFFGRISRIYDIIFSNHKYFSSKLLYYYYYIRNSLYALHLRPSQRSCQKNYDPLFLCRTARAHTFRSSDRGTVHVDCRQSSTELRFIFFILLFALYYMFFVCSVSVRVLLIGFHRCDTCKRQCAA